jgi:hypothetical protein
MLFLASDHYKGRSSGTSQKIATRGNTVGGFTVMQIYFEVTQKLYMTLHSLHFEYVESVEFLNSISPFGKLFRAI